MKATKEEFYNIVYIILAAGKCGNTAFEIGNQLEAKGLIEWEEK